MAQFLEQYIHRIKSCEDYDSLASTIDICISKNVINHLSIELKDAIDSLELNTPYTNFVKSLVWSSTVSDHSEASLNILRYFCNKVASEFDSLLLPLDDFTFMVVAICADDKSFISKMSSEKKDVLINTLSKWYLTDIADDKDVPIIMEQMRLSIDLILQGKSMEELDFYFKNKYEIDISYDNVNRIIRPFQALFINIAQNIDQETLLHQINVDEWENAIRDKMNEIAARYSKTSKGEFSPCFYRMFIHDTLLGFEMLNNKLASTGYTNIANPVVGEFLLGFLNVLHYYYNDGNFDTNIISSLLNDAKTIFYSNFAVSEPSRYIINTIITTYTSSGDFEDSLLRGDFFEALKFHLRSDELFKLWLENTENTKHKSLPDRVYATYVHHYLSPELEAIEQMFNIDSSEEILEVATEASKSKLKSKIKRNGRESMDDDNNDDQETDRNRSNKYPEDEQNEDSDNEQDDQNDENYQNDDEEYQDENDESQDDNDEEYDGPEIDAKQSNKGYKRASKKQSDGERKIYGAYKKYKNNEAKVDSQLSKMLSSAKRAFTPDKTEEIIEGKKFSPIGLLKKILVTAAIFNYNKVAGFVYLLVSHTINKKRTIKQKNEILIQIETELKMMDEKIEDARGDGNRKAKYALMRTKAELERARDKIKYNLTATKQDMKIAKKYVNNDYRDNV
jgi:hypothetical protein